MAELRVWVAVAAPDGEAIADCVYVSESLGVDAPVGAGDTVDDLLEPGVVRGVPLPEADLLDCGEPADVRLGVAARLSLAAAVGSFVDAADSDAVREGVTVAAAVRVPLAETVGLELGRGKPQMSYPCCTSPCAAHGEVGTAVRSILPQYLPSGSVALQLAIIDKTEEERKGIVSPSRVYPATVGMPQLPLTPILLYGCAMTRICKNVPSKKYMLPVPL
jgi:hypothetical protein